MSCEIKLFPHQVQLQEEARPGGLPVPAVPASSADPELLQAEGHLCSEALKGLQ